ncbi:hypothetical protein [Mycoplasma struthionis]|uniref:Uncharacterized protein n=1 Tax=Mycoplasma struthionis TaxID=538220 RepID=A0A502M2D1_9MOLU|nr:hypothetical protein [Mycoplasma struthionis]TPI01836.1 hypothetical protein FJM01_01800 [Mycoplasma struthionis]
MNLKKLEKNLNYKKGAFIYKINAYSGYLNFLKRAKEKGAGDLTFPCELRANYEEDVWSSEAIEKNQQAHLNKDNQSKEKPKLQPEDIEFPEWNNPFEISPEKMFDELYNAAKDMGLDEDKIEDFIRKTFDEFDNLGIDDSENKQEIREMLEEYLKKTIEKKHNSKKFEVKPKPKKEDPDPGEVN